MARFQQHVLKGKIMTSDPKTNIVSNRHYNVIKTTSILTYILIVLGGVVCFTESARGCPDWPGCFGKLIPPLQVDAIIEYFHRLVAAITGPFLLAAAYFGWKKTPSINKLKWLPLVATVFAIAVAMFGRRAVLYGLPPELAVIDLGLALLTLALMATTTVAGYALRKDSSSSTRLSFNSPFARLTLGTLAMVYLVLVSSVLVAEEGSVIRCVSWPMYFGRLAPDNLNTWPQILRLTAAGIASIMIFAVVLQARQMFQEKPAVLKAANAVGLLFVVEIIVGVIMLLFGYNVILSILFVSTASAVWGGLVVLTVLVGLAGSKIKGEK